MLPQMLTDDTVFLLRAEQDDLRILGYCDGVTGRPEEEIAAVVTLILP